MVQNNIFQEGKQLVSLTAMLFNIDYVLDNQMWILKNSKDLLEYIQSRSLSSCSNINTFDFSTFHTTIPHPKLKDRLKEYVCVS
jgi:hypothetical protein